MKRQTGTRQERRCRTFLSFFTWVASTTEVVKYDSAGLSFLRWWVKPSRNAMDRWAPANSEIFDTEPSSALTGTSGSADILKTTYW